MKKEQGTGNRVSKQRRNDPSQVLQVAGVKEGGEEN